MGLSIYRDGYFGGRYLLVDSIGNIIKGYDTLKQALEENPDVPLGDDYDDPG